jgi:hypothetical protein
MGRAARSQVSAESWDSVFEKMYGGYKIAI